MSTQQYFEANQNARVEKVQKVSSNETNQRVDPFKQEAKKYSRAGWGNAKASGQENDEQKPKK